MQSIPKEHLRGYSFVEEIAYGVFLMKDQQFESVVGKFIRLTTFKDEVAFKNEVDIMEKFSKITVPVITSWICEYDHINRFTEVEERVKYGVIIMPLGQPLSKNDIIENVSDIKDILSYMKRYGLMHRDLKVENLLMYEGHIKVIDFGLSLLYGTVDVNEGEINFTYEVIPSFWSPTYDTKTLAESFQQYQLVNIL
jgi:serine/threonine protein kinase